MDISKYKALCLAAVSLSVVVVASTYSYTSIYKDRSIQCLSSSMSGVSSDIAARAIANACSDIDSDKQPLVGKILSKDELGRVTGQASLSNPMFNTRLTGRLYNGNTETVVKSTVLLVEFRDKDKLLHSTPYLITKEIQPLSVEEFSIPVLSYAGDFSWNIDSALGRKADVMIK